MESSMVQQDKVAFGRLWWVTLLAIAAASAANILVYFIAIALFDGPRQFVMLAPTSIVVSTAVFLIVAAIVYALVGRFTRQPVQTFRKLSVVALLLSFLAPIGTALSMPPAEAPDATTIVVLIVMHVVAAIITVGLFTALARKA